jgi:plastocyanin
MDHGVIIRVVNGEVVVDDVEVEKGDTVTWVSIDHPHSGRYTKQSATDLSSWSGAACEPVVGTVIADPGVYEYVVTVSQSTSGLAADPHVIVTKSKA